MLLLSVLGPWAVSCLPLHAQATLSLHEAIQRAQASPSAQVADALVSQAQGVVRQAGLGPNPRLYLQSEDLRPWSDSYSFPTQSESYGYLGQVFEVDGKRRKRVAFAQAKLHQAEAERALQLRQIAIRVAGAYWNAVGLQRISTLLEQDIQAVDAMVRYHKERVDAGAMRGVDLLRMQIERDRLQLAREAARREAEQAQLELFRQMGQPFQQVALSDSLEGSFTMAPIVLSDTLAQRPDLQAARDAVTAAEEDVTLQRASGVPDPDFFAGYKRNSADNTLYAALQIPLPLRNRNQGEIERARASVTAAKASLALLETRVTLEVEQARKSFDAQQKIVNEILPQMREHAKQNLAILTEAYRIGGVDLLRYIDAERTEFDVEVSAVRTLMQLRESAVQLQLATGVQP